MGQVGAAFKNPNTFDADPSGFSGSEWGARFLGGAGKGLLNGFSNMQQQNSQMRQGGGGAMPQVAAAVPSNIQFSAQNFTPGGSGPRPTKNPFFYGYGEGS
ncbi:MAG: hypothetical protein JO356_01070 [Acidobacteria bacterium]|nr:hypothetical protein [Acidobacteriota bacterium]